MRYLDKLKTIPDDAPDNALYLGTALHTGIETNSVEKAIAQYYSNYSIITDDHVNEAIKLEAMIPKAIAMVPHGRHEVEILDSDFRGYIDLLVPVGNEGGIKIYDLYDFKYSNNVANYLKSDQLHLYKFYFEKTHPDCQIRSMCFLMVPKSKCKQIKGEDLLSYRQRLRADLDKLKPNLVYIEYDPTKVIRFLTETKHLVEADSFPMHTGFLCQYCEYFQFCQKGYDYMLLPKNERRSLEKATKKVIWIYGSPFSGKTTFANKFPDPLMLNTDGNIKFVDAPFIAIRDEVTKTGRMTNRKMAWEIFKEVIAELELKENTFKTIVVDLLEDLYEYCRLYMYNELGIKHESDDSFRAWDKVRTEFLSTIKKLMALDYENIILISHLDSTKDLTKKGGDKLSTIKPNIQDKIANKVAGMVDIVARTIAEDGEFTLNFKRSEVIFGGGRLQFKEGEIPLEYENFCALYEEAQGKKKNGKKTTSVAQNVPCKDTEQKEVPSEVPEKAPWEEPAKEEPAKVEPDSEKEVDKGVQEEPPVRRRKRRTEN